MKAIVAVDEDWGIGVNGQMLHHVPADLKYFKQKTLGKTVIMGKNTFFSLPNGPLPGRKNIVLSTDKNLHIEGAWVYSSIDELMENLSKEELADAFIIGGQSIYEQFLPLYEIAFVTKIVARSLEIDAYFPNLDILDEWKLISESDIMVSNDIRYKFCEYRQEK